MCHSEEIFSLHNLHPFDAIIVDEVISSGSIDIGLKKTVGLFPCPIFLPASAAAGQQVFEVVVVVVVVLLLLIKLQKQ